jgi:lycopene cyclase domain-containing protein
MTYALIDAAFLAAAAVLAFLLRLGRQPFAAPAPGLKDTPLRHGVWVPAIVAGAALLALTAVFDNAMIAAGLFGYSPETLLGPAVGLAPLEDFAYPLAAAILLPVLWRRLSPAGRRQPGEAAVPAHRHPDRRVPSRSRRGTLTAGDER